MADKKTKKLEDMQKRFEALKAKESKEDKEEENQIPSGLPQRDLKKNLGCGSEKLLEVAPTQLIVNVYFYSYGS